MFSLESDGELVPQVAGGAVIGYFSGIFAFMSGIGISTLFGPLITGGKVEIDAFRWAEDSSPMSGQIVASVCFLSVERAVFVEAAKVLIAESCTKGKVLGRTMVVCRARAIIIICSGTEHDVRTLIVHRVLGIDADESADGVASVECSLRTSKHIYSVGITQILVHTAHVG